MDSVTLTSSAVLQRMTSVPTDNEHHVSIGDNGAQAHVSRNCESAPVILHKMDAGSDEIIQSKAVTPFSPGIPRSSPVSLSNEISGQMVSVGITNNGSQAFGAFPRADEAPDKADSVAKPSPERSPQLNYSFATCSDVSQSCNSSSVPSSLNPSGVSSSCNLLTAPGSISNVTFSAPSSQTNKVQQQGVRSDLPQPPKKPLSPYMRFSKGIWQQVKTANPGMSVCEVGAAIGRIWRELDDTSKQQFILEFNNDKARYDTELQGYLRMNGLQASDIIKPRAKKTPKDPTSAKRSKCQNQKNQDAQHDLAAGTNYHRPVATIQCPTSDAPQMNYAGQEHGNQEISVALPSFSQVWPNPDAATQRDLLAQVVYDSQLHVEREVSEVESRSMPVFPSQAQLAATSIPSTVSNNEQKVQQVKVPASHVKTEADDWWWPVEDNKRFLGTSILPQTENAAMQQPSAGGPSFAEGTVKTEECVPNKTSQGMSSNGNWNGGNGIMACNGTAAGNAWMGQQPDAAQRVQNAAEEKGTAIDAEKLFLRGALVEKTQEVVQLMRELDQAYGLIHQLKTQNDFFHRWYQEQRNAQE